MKQESQPRGKGQTIKVEPKLNWPTLSDANTGGRDVEEFYERFEEMVGLANNATGMAYLEMMVCLKGCLAGSRRKIHDNIVKLYRNATTNKIDDPKECYLKIN